MRAFPALALLATLVLAGCAGSNQSGSDSDPNKAIAGGKRLPLPGVDDGWAELALLDDETHDHRKPTDHQNRTTPNFEILGYEPLITDYYGKTAGSYFCGTTNEKDGQRLSIIASWGSDVAFVLVDTTDINNPQKLGELVMANTNVYDVTLTPDQRYAVLGTSPYDSGPDMQIPKVPPLMTWRDACTGEERVLDGPESGLPWASGVVLVDISNPRNPVIVDFRNFPVFGGHSVRAEEWDGVTYILTSVGNRAYASSYYVLMHIEELPGGARMIVDSMIQDIGNGGEVHYAEGLCCTHDGFLQTHPATGEQLVYLAYGPAGLVIYDADEPGSPEWLSRWTEWDQFLGESAPANAFFHEALPMPELWDGRHYTFIGEECINHPATTPTCVVIALDTTDPRKPEFMGAWTLPIDVSWEGGLQYSLHYIAVQNRTLFVSVYHAGLWAIDVSTPEAMRMMPSVGVFMPANESPKPIGGNPPRSAAGNYALQNYVIDSTPTVLDLDPTSDGNMVVFDTTSGLYTVHFDPSRPAPAPMPWPMKYHNDTPE